MDQRWTTGSFNPSMTQGGLGGVLVYESRVTPAPQSSGFLDQKFFEDLGVMFFFGWMGPPPGEFCKKKTEGKCMGSRLRLMG